MSNLNVLTLQQLGTLLQAVWDQPNPSTVVVLGPPGAAKTSFARGEALNIVARINNVEPSAVGYLEFLAGGRDTTDITGIGLPAKSADGTMTTVLTRPALLTAIEDKLAQPGIQYLVLNLDEISQCDQGMTKTLRSVIDADTRTLGGFAIPDNVYIMATGNRVKDKAASGRLLSHAANAVHRVELGFDFDCWAAWAEGTGAIHPTVIAAGRLCHSEGNFFADSVPAEDTQFNTARSFARFAVPYTRHAGGVDASTLPQDMVSQHMAASSMGEQAADMFFVTLGMMGHVPTMAEIQANPLTATLSDETHFQFAAAQAALQSAVSSATAEQATQYIVRLRRDLQISTIAALCSKALHGAKPFPLIGKHINEFITKHADLLPLAEGIDI